MSWVKTEFSWEHVRAFLAAAHENSLGGAARLINTTQPTVGRQVTALEEALGVILFERSGRGLLITESGRELLHHAHAMGQAAARLSLSAASQSQEVSGEVAIAASDLMAAAILPPILVRLQQAAPGIRLRIVASGDIQDLTQREADIAIRHVRTKQPELIARHLTDFRATLYGSSDYFEKHGKPESHHNLLGHKYLSGSDKTRLIDALAERGIHIQEEDIVLSTASGVVLLEALKNGLGLTMMPETIGDRDENLERVSEQFPSMEFPTWLVTHRELFTSRRIRVVFDMLAEALRAA